MIAYCEKYLRATVIGHYINNVFIIVLCLTGGHWAECGQDGYAADEGKQEDSRPHHSQTHRRLHRPAQEGKGNS